MPITYTDNEIERLTQERKPLPVAWYGRVRLKPKRGHDEWEMDLTGEANSAFRLILRWNHIDRLDFSIILMVRVPGSSQWFRLRRCNGKHEHTNHIEKMKFRDFHIHVATKRYQELGTREDAYAEATNQYDDFYGALRCLFDDANFSEPNDSQLGLFY